METSHNCPRRGCGLLIAGGLAGRMWLPGFFKVWGRFEMGLLAEFQFCAYGAGMLLVSIPFADPSLIVAFRSAKSYFSRSEKRHSPPIHRPTCSLGKETRRFGCVLWIIGAAVLSYFVLDSLPP